MARSSCQQCVFKLVFDPMTKAFFFFLLKIRQDKKKQEEEEEAEGEKKKNQGKKSTRANTETKNVHVRQVF